MEMQKLLLNIVDTFLLMFALIVIVGILVGIHLRAWSLWSQGDPGFGLVLILIELSMFIGWTLWMFGIYV